MELTGPRAALPFATHKGRVMHKAHVQVGYKGPSPPTLPGVEVISFCRLLSVYDSSGRLQGGAVDRELRATVTLGG